MAPFSVIVFGVVVWTITVSGGKQLRFRLKADYCGRGLRPDKLRARTGDAVSCSPRIVLLESLPNKPVHQCSFPCGNK